MWKFTNIPKKAHFYWGASPLPLSRYLTLLSFRRQNPDWEMLLHRPTCDQANGKVYASEYTGRCFMDEASKICDIEYLDFGWLSGMWDVHKSDLIRWHLLRKVGGIWSDMDIFYIKPMSELRVDGIVSGSEVELILCYSDPLHHHSIGLIGSSIEQREMVEISSSCGTKLIADKFQCIGSDMLYEVGINCKYMLTNFPRIANLNFFSIYQCGTSGIQMLHDKRIPRYNRDAILGVHWYAGSEHSLPFQNARNIEEIANLGSFMSKLVVEAGYDDELLGS